MKREIKFRIRDRKTKKIIANSVPIHKIYFGDLEPDAYIVEQYTGLKDKNGVEIYEGDIIKDNQGILWKVTFFDAGFSIVQLEDENEQLPMSKLWVYEVIGNIHTKQ